MAVDRGGKLATEYEVAEFWEEMLTVFSRTMAENPITREEFIETYAAMNKDEEREAAYLYELLTSGKDRDTILAELMAWLDV